MGKKFLIILIVFFTLTNSIFSEKKAEIKTGMIPFPYIIPGVEQIKRGYYFKGILFLSGFSTCLTEAYLKNRDGNSYYDRYLESTVVDEIVSLREKTEDSFKKRNYYLVGAFSVWLLHILDLQFFDKKKGIKGEIHKDSFSIGFYYSF